MYNVNRETYHALTWRPTQVHGTPIILAKQMAVGRKEAVSATASMFTEADVSIIA